MSRASARLFFARLAVSIVSLQGRCNSLFGVYRLGNWRRSPFTNAGICGYNGNEAHDFVGLLERTQDMSERIECARCHGAGYLSNGMSPCPVCKGAGWVLERDAEKDDDWDEDEEWNEEDDELWDEDEEDWDEDEDEEDWDEDEDEEDWDDDWEEDEEEDLEALLLQPSL